MVLAKEEVVVVVQMNVEYEGEDSALDEEEWQLLLERTIQLWMGQQ